MARRDTILVNRSLYQMGIATVIGAILWIGVSVYHALVKPPEVAVDQTLLTPINPVIDQAVIASLSGRLFIETIPIEQPVEQNASISGEEVQ